MKFKTTLILITTAALVAASCGQRKKTEIKTRSIEYKSEGKTMEGYLAEPVADGARPGILVIHEWTGLGDYAKKRADMLAELGYVAFAMDMYGKGIYAKDHNEAGKLSGTYFKDRSLMRKRMEAGMQVLTDVPGVDKSKLAAIGYCFGGGAVIELALSGADIQGVVSFHGFPGSPNIADAKNIKADILFHHGAADSMVSLESANNLPATLKQNGLPADRRVEVVVHEGAPHAFTRFTDPSVYKEKADKESWASMLDFFDAKFR